MGLYFIIESWIPVCHALFNNLYNAAGRVHRREVFELRANVKMVWRLVGERAAIVSWCRSCSDRPECGTVIVAGEVRVRVGLCKSKCGMHSVVELLLLLLEVLTLVQTRIAATRRATRVFAFGHNGKERRVRIRIWIRIDSSSVHFRVRHDRELPREAVELLVRRLHLRRRMTWEANQRALGGRFLDAVRLDARCRTRRTRCVACRIHRRA